MAKTYEHFFEIANVTQHHQFEEFISNIVFNKEKRNKFYADLLDINYKLDKDIFMDYLQEYSTDRKMLKQDFTPPALAKLLSKITDQKNEALSSYDATAGSGALLIAKWNEDRYSKSPFEYFPSDYLYYANELSDLVLPKLIHNLAIRGMNAIVIHGDVLTGETTNIYFIQNTKNDFMAFSDVNVMPRSEDVTKYFKVNKWIGESINHIESTLEDLMLKGVKFDE